LKKGKIFSFDSSSGKGLILLDDGSKFDFNINNWNILQSIPIVGMVVKVLDGKIVNIELTENTIADKQKKITFSEMKEYLFKNYSNLGFTNIKIDENLHWQITNKDIKNSYIDLSTAHGTRDGKLVIKFYNIETTKETKNFANKSYVFEDSDKQKEQRKAKKISSSLVILFFIGIIVALYFAFTSGNENSNTNSSYKSNESVRYTNDCNYYFKKMQYYNRKALEISRKKPLNFCSLADALESFMNYAGSTKNACPENRAAAIDILIVKFTPILGTATLKCGY